MLRRLLTAAGRTATDAAALPLRGLARAERRALQLLAGRLDAVQEHGLTPAASHEPERVSQRPAADRDALAHQLDHLLQQAVGQSTNGGRIQIYASLVAQLVPDEARMLASLADGRSAAVVHIVPRSGRSGPSLVENFSSIGRRAGVALPQLVATYVTHLLQLGLVELGPEDPELELEYELLMAETIVREALALGKRSGRLSPRVVRQRLRLSQLGHDLWATSHAAGSSAAD
jgi:hypothetical protein